ncbi:chromosomal replication initiator protein DnaA [Chitinivibrio alkaliphilus ACht1]|uniref:Chromosomal replication initiator protein DnaA n=1 Tax=Chitinivibrio alkaliphilus ACht1 TaxID=1313304 RepID=U7D858_9BACT|nr:chromosomal replication initiator protein DnaA [Chitinivibrio alkaliphilus ACht1]
MLHDVRNLLKDPVQYEAYFGNTELLRIHEETAVVSIHNQFVQDIVEEHYGSMILTLLRKKTANAVKAVAFEVVEREKITEQVDISAEEESASQREPESRIINGNLFYPDYTFDTFVVGKSNQMAYHAALSVSEAPGMTSFNPFTIYGKSGLGKTHLLQAIGHFCKHEGTAENIYYITAHDFLQRFLDFIYKRRDLNAFYREFHHVDVLLIDDIHFLSNKIKTQECFYSIFSKLINLNKQIILTSDRLPSEIPHMQENLVNRFKNGLVVDIKPPSLKTRLSILKQKAKTDNIQLSDDVLEYMASQITTNIRALEGVLTKVLASSIFCNRELDLETVQVLLDDYRRERKENVSIEKIQNTVSAYFDISPNQLRAHTRKKSISFPRSIAMYLSRKMTKQALRSIGLEFGGRDYSTVIYACKKIEKLRETDTQFKTTLTSIEERIRTSSK